ncbi:coiled-coil domain-containing protein 39-like isoform X2 [Convolutriloba macropyga]|uniref:coiled-coil domain-containing protein 39-like isoform X2 n=1 Tax=Convolutriloba macropyga TaxID=536237 RepID=UPI003F527458
MMASSKNTEQGPSGESQHAPSEVRDLVGLQTTSNASKSELQSVDALSSSLAGDWSGSVKKYYMNEVMEELGWTEFVQAPPPNWDNLLIVDDMQKTKAKSDKIKREISYLDEEMKRDGGQLKEVKTALKEEREIAETHQTGIETEKQHKALLNTQLSACRAAIRDHLHDIRESEEICSFWNQIKSTMQKRSEESQETTDDVMAQLETYSDRILLIDQMKCRVNKYFKMDEAKLGKKEREVATLQQALLDLKAKMDEERIKTNELHAGLDVEAEDFKKLIKERQEIVDQWSRVIEQQKRRDQEMAEQRNQLQQLIKDVEEKEDCCQQQASFSGHMRDTNEEKMREIEAKDREKAKVFDEKRAVDAEMDELLRQSLALQRNVTNVAYQLQKAREDIRCLNDERDQKEEWERNVIATKEFRKAELDKAKSGELNAEERLTKIDEEHVETEKMIERQRKVLEDKSSEKYAKMNQLFQMRNEEKRLQTDIEGTAKIMAGLDRRIDKYDVELLHLLDRYVVLEFNVQKLQVKLQEMTFRKEDDSEDDSLKRKIHQLKNNLEKLEHTIRRYEKECGKQKTELKLVKADFEKNQELEASLTETRDHEDRYIDNCVRILDLTKRRKEESLKDFCVHKMRHLALEKAEKCSAEKLHEKEDKLDFMASTQDEMKLLMKLTAEQNAYELRLLKEANSKVKNDLGQKQVTLGQRKKLYETLLARTPNKSSQEMSISEFVEERESLKKQGDKLDKDVRRELGSQGKVRWENEREISRRICTRREHVTT